MNDWTFLWRAAPDGLLLDANDDGLVDGVAACIVPIGAEEFSADLWAACANFAARLGLESPSIRLPLTSTIDALQPWQVAVVVAIPPLQAALAGTGWANAAREVLYENEEGEVAWLRYDGRSALWIHADSARKLAELVHAMACGISDLGSMPERTTHESAYDLAQLFTASAQGFFIAASDGYTPDDARVVLGLGPAISAEEGCAAIDLAARMGMESGGLSLPLAYALADAADAGAGWLLLGFEDQPSPRSVLDALSNLALNAETARYVARDYPFLSRSAKMERAEMHTVTAVSTAVRSIVNGHSPQIKAALGAVQTGSAASNASAGGPREVFSHVWQPPDGHDNVSRVRSGFVERVLPELVSRANPRSEQGMAVRSVLTVFCSAPLAARRKLQAEIEEQLDESDLHLDLLVLPSHKAALAWIGEYVLPMLTGLPVATVDLAFSEFRSSMPDVRWLDLPTRWLQEWFPVQEVVCAELALVPDQVHLRMTPAGDEPQRRAVYRITAHAQDGTVLHDAALSVLYTEREYLAGMPDQGLVHPSSAGFVLEGPAGVRQWTMPTDEDLFWDFFQECILPAVRAHVLEVSRGRPTPDNEPYFERMEIEGAFGWPDEPLPLYEEFISVGEALHEDLYFNTLDYLAALGERFCGRPITAAGQVLPYIHDYLQSNGDPCARSGPRAHVRLFAWPYPAYRPEQGIVAGDRRDLPKAKAITVSRLTVADSGDHVSDIVVQVQYANRGAAEFAGRVLERWREDGGSFPGCHGILPSRCSAVQAQRWSRRSTCRHCPVRRPQVATVLLPKVMS